MTLKTICSPGNSLSVALFKGWRTSNEQRNRSTAAESPGRGGVESFPGFLPEQLRLATATHGQILFVHWTTGRSSGHLWWNVCLDPFLLVLKKIPTPFIWEVVDASTTLSSVHLKNFYSVACIFAGKITSLNLQVGKVLPVTLQARNPTPGTPKNSRAPMLQFWRVSTSPRQSPWTEIRLGFEVWWNFRSLKKTQKSDIDNKNGPYFKLESPFPRPIMLKSVNLGT